MLEFYLMRSYETKEATIGVLLSTFKNTKTDSVTSFLCYTLELPWNNNIPDESRIAAGEYDLFFKHSPKFRRDLLMVEDKNGRKNICFHAGNKPSHSKGSILLGRRVEKNKINSARAAEDALRRFSLRKLGEELASESGNMTLKIIEGGNMNA